MLVQTIVFFAPRTVLRPSFVQNVNTFGAQTIGADTTTVLTAPFVANNNSFGNLMIEAGTPQVLEPTLVQNVNTFETPTIGEEPPSPLVEDALLVDDADSELLITPDDYLRIQE